MVWHSPVSDCSNMLALSGSMFCYDKKSGVVSRHASKTALYILWITKAILTGFKVANFHSKGGINICGDFTLLSSDKDLLVSYRYYHLGLTLNVTSCKL